MSGRSLEFALLEARSLGHASIDTEHILLGLTHEYEGVAAHILRKRGVDARTITTQVMHMLSGLGDEEV